MILALDTALKTGYAYGAGGDITFGTYDLSDFPSDNAVRGRMFRRFLVELLNELEPQDICIETPVHFRAGPNSGQQSGILLYGLAWEVHRAAELRNIPRHEVYPGTIKKFATGNGHAKKPEVIEAIINKGYAVEDDNQADAVAMLLYKMSLGEQQ